MPDCTRRDFLRTVGLGALAIAAGHAQPPVRRPNVVFILADDLGWRDTSAYGSRFLQTPNLDRLMARGMRFTQAYAANPLCSPTRASFMTGLHPARIGITSASCHQPEVLLQPEAPERGSARWAAVSTRSATRLALEHRTLAEALGDAGYRTGHFGKWHLGAEPYDPTAQGFDVDVPHHAGPGPAGSYVAPWRFPPALGFTGQPGEHIEDRMADEAIRFLHAHRASESRDRPFYLNYWAFSVHSPFDAKPELIARHRGRVDPADPQRCPVYAAMVESFDQNVGRLLDTLDELRLSDDTILVFWSDNGGCMYEQVDGVTVTDNAPLRGGKATLYEGGTRVPAAVVWPGRVRPGSVSDQMVQSIDLYPTLLDALGLPPAAGQRFDGISFLPTLRGGRLEREAIYCWFPHTIPSTGAEPGAWVRRGDWKLIRTFYGGPDGGHRYELYNLADDLGETRNLAAAQPERVRELDALIDGFLRDTGALRPARNPAWLPEAPGWEQSKDTQLSVEDGALVLESTGSDPFVWTSDVPRVPGPVTLEVRLRSTAAGEARCYWGQVGVQPLFTRERSVVAPVRHDGEWHELSVALPLAGTLAAVRLDPASAPGRIDLAWLRLKGADGTVVREWRFGAEARR